MIIDLNHCQYAANFYWYIQFFIFLIVIKEINISKLMTIQNENENSHQCKMNKLRYFELYVYFFHQFFQFHL